MNFKKPKFWDAKSHSFYSLLFWPLSRLFEFSYIFKPKNKHKFKNIKTICVGNIYLGGTGKTSLAIKISELLKDRNIKVCFIKKLYPDQKDEIKLLKKHGKLFASHSRIKSLKKAVKQKYKVAIFDDGLQDYSIKYDLKFICFNNINWIGNGNVIPAGPLRENIKNLKNYKYMFLNGNLENLKKIKSDINKINPKIKLFHCIYNPININEFDLSKKYIAFSGIGNHKTFISMLKKNKFKVTKEIEFPDHYNYTKDDLNKIILKSNQLNCKIITTEKDFLRINPLKFNEIKFIKSELHIQDEQKLINAIFNLDE